MSLFRRQHVVCAALLTLVVIGGAGCAGINTTQSVSPLDFLLPGSRFLRGQTTPPPAAPGSNEVFVAVQPVPSGARIP